MELDTLVKLSGSAVILLILLRLDTSLHLTRLLLGAIYQSKIMITQKLAGVMLLLTVYFSFVGYNQSDFLGVCIATLAIIFLF